MDSKQVILVRKDIKIPKGKLAAQVAHASVAVMLDLVRLGQVYSGAATRRLHARNEAIENWINGSFTKVCLEVENENEMLEFHKQAFRLMIPTSFIIDSGRTVFDKPTATCCAIGPWFSSEIDKLTGELKLL